MDMVCDNCGTTLPERAVFCAKCGQRVRAAGSESTSLPLRQGMPAADERSVTSSPHPAATRGRRFDIRLLGLAVVALIAVGIYLLVHSLNAGWSISLKADWTSVGTGSTVHLTATANKKVDGSAYFITLKDATTGATVATCEQGSTCVGTVRRTQPSSESFIATIGDQAHSANVLVAWRHWNLQLTASTVQPKPGQQVTLTALANGDFDLSHYRLAIVDVTAGDTVKGCGSQMTCSATPPAGIEGDAYAARVSDSGLEVADSGAVTVGRQITWTAWEPQQSGTSAYLTSVTFIDARNGWAVGTNFSVSPPSSVILHTADGGATWQQQYNGTSGELNAVAFAEARDGWTVGNDTILHTTDGGSTWRPQHSGTTAFLFGVAFLDARDGWAVGADTSVSPERSVILHTSDGGATWQPQQSGTSSILQGVMFRDKHNGWVVGENGTILHITGQ
jgi:photosystem II stability/assembly factor-like uncharacterized protein